MNDNSWDNLTDAIDVKFGITKHGQEDRPLAENPSLKEHVRYIQFSSGGNQFRAERIASPAIIERKAVGGKRIGAGVHYENIYDTEDKTLSTKFYRQEGTDWTGVNAEALSSLL